jgi:hypothetical protein
VKKKLKKKLIIFSILLSLLVFINSPLFPLQSIAFADNNASTIGGVGVSGMNEGEIRDALTKAIKEYKDSTIEVSGAGTKVKIDPAEIQFKVEETIQEYISQTDKPWYAIWESKKKVNIPLQISPNDAIKQQIAAVPQWDADQTYNNLMLIASLLRSHEVEATTSSLAGIDNERIAVSIVEIPATITDIQTVIDFIPERVITSGEEISFLDEMAPILGSISRDTVNFVASAFYQTALRMNGQIVERYTHTELPSYIQPGLDAFVSSAQNKNLRFSNTLSQPVKLKISREGLNLKVEAYAVTAEDAVSIRVSRDKEVEPRTISRFSLDLPIGKYQVIQEGKAGLRVTVYRSSAGEEKVISKDYYPPTNTILLKSARVPATTTGSGTSTGGTEPTPTEPSEEIKFDENGKPIEKDDKEYDKGGKVTTSGK